MSDQNIDEFAKAFVSKLSGWIKSDSEIAAYLQKELLAAKPKEHPLVKRGCPVLHAERDPNSLTGEPFLGALGRITARINRGSVIGLCGERGRGKTQIGVEVCRQATQVGLSWRFITLADLLANLRDARKMKWVSEVETLETWRLPKVLVIDELRFSTNADTAGDEAALLFSLVNARYGSRKDTLMIGNQDKTTFEKAVGESTVSRMEECGGVIVCNWPSYRGKAPK